KVSVVGGIAITNSYVFDNLSRLLSEKLNSDAAVSYSYDLAGNCLSAGGSSYTYTHNKLDGVLHDSSGNITNMVQNGVTLDLAWNSQGQLTSVSTNGVFAESNTWGPLGNRLSTSNANGVVFHAYNGAQCIADYTASGDLLASYTWGSGIDNLLAVAVYDGNTTNTYYAVKDHLNSVHALIDDSGSTVMTVAYNAWSTPLNSSLSIQNSSFRLRYLWQGREYSYATGLYNFRARWYFSSVGRWISKDPIGLEGGLNLYVFCGNNPVNFVDPWGFCEERYGKRMDAIDQAINQLDPITGWLSQWIVNALRSGVDAARDFEKSGLSPDAAINMGSIQGTTRAVGEEAIAVATMFEVASGAARGKEYKVGDNTRIAPYGNRAGHKTGKYPHYHRRGVDPITGKTRPGQSLKRHRPWDTRSTDTGLGDRF
ncbi:MAG: RHS repeat-associated core domain-containing protein, partial [Candidatus Cloacimonetes bacterium]|nr:RHS repeat-associated core domain-containing protein [Candidatus Cloacimonadota bacterium]